MMNDLGAREAGGEESKGGGGETRRQGPGEDARGGGQNSDMGAAHAPPARPPAGRALSRSPLAP